MEPITRKITLKLVSLPGFGVVSLNCNHVEGFQKSEKLETLSGFGGRLICMEFWRPLTAYSLGTMQYNITKLGKLIYLLIQFEQWV